MTRGADAHCALLRALRLQVPDLRVLDSRCVPWASVSFTGARHLLICAEHPAAFALAEAEFAVSGHLVADVAVIRAGDRVQIEVLTIETE